MKFSKLMMITVITASIIMTATAFAAYADGTTGTVNYGAACLRGTGNFGGPGYFGGKGLSIGKGNTAVNQDPIERLKDMKANLDALVKSGKITQDQAKLEADRIDERIKEIEAFNKLTLEQKKAKVIADFKAKLNQEVKDQNMTQKVADQLLKNFQDKVSAMTEIPCPISGPLGSGMGGFGGKMGRGGFGGRMGMGGFGGRMGMGGFCGVKSGR